MQTEQVDSFTRFERELEEWRRAMPGEGFIPEQIEKRVKSLRYVIAETKAGSMWGLTSRALAAWLSDRAAEGTMKRGTINTYLSLVSSCAETLKQKGLIHHNPAETVKRAKGADLPGTSPYPFNGAEVDRLIAAAEMDEALDKPRHAAHRSTIYRLLFLSGGRRRETSRIRWRDLNLSGSPATVTFLGKAGRVDTIPLPPAAVESLRILAERRGGVNPDDRIFPHWPKDEVLLHDAEAAGIELEDKRGRRVRWKSFRTGLATSMVRSGVPLAHAQKILRHRDPKTTASYYAQLEHEDLAEELEKVTSTMRGGGGRGRAAGGSVAQVENVDGKSLDKVGGGAEDAGGTSEIQREMVTAPPQNRPDDGTPSDAALPTYHRTSRVSSAFRHHAAVEPVATAHPQNENRPSGQDGRFSAIGVGGFEPPTF